MKKLLIVEDERMTQRLILRIAESMGIVSIVASNGLRGLQMLEDNPDFSAIVVDYKMPEMDGKTFIKETRKQQDFVNIPIIMCSAFISVKEIGSLLDIGATAFMAKPINRGEFENFLKKYLLSPIPNISAN